MIPLTVLIIDLYRYSRHLVKYLKNVFISVFTLFLKKIILFFKGQFGFRSCYSSNHTILNLVESIKKCVVIDNFVHSVFIGLEKAFYTVDHQILSQKFYHYGFQGLVHNWFRSFLSN